MSCLCLGAQSAGKTLLLKQLQNQGVSQTTVPIETVGTNILTIPSTGEKGRRGEGRGEKDVVGIREIGGAMAALWPSYYAPSITTVLFVVDSSNLFQVSMSTVLLMEILSHEKLTGARVLLVLTKQDLTTRKKLNYLKFMMRLDNIVKESEKRVSVEEVSGLTGEGIENVRSWIFQNSPPKSRLPLPRP